MRTDIKGNELSNSNAVGMAQKLLLFWRKPARRCWWEGVELDNVDGVEGKLKVWIRRVWTLEMVRHLLRKKSNSIQRKLADLYPERYWLAVRLRDHLSILVIDLTYGKSKRTLRQIVNTLTRVYLNITFVGEPELAQPVSHITRTVRPMHCILAVCIEIGVYSFTSISIVLAIRAENGFE